MDAGPSSYRSSSNNLSSSHPQQQPPLVNGNNPHYFTSPGSEQDSYRQGYDPRLTQFDGARPEDQLGSSSRFNEEWDASQRGSSIVSEQRRNNQAAMQRANSVQSYAPGDDQQMQSLPARSNTLKKKQSLRRAPGGSMRRSSSRRSMKAGSVRSLALASTSDPDEARSAFYCPVPTKGNPTEILSSRFQVWRKILKDLIAYFREIQSHYEGRSKSLVKLANVSNNITTPSGFLTTAGIDDALQFLRSYNKNAIIEAGKAKDIEEDVILALTGLRSDLQQKIKEIKHLSGDFKNGVEKEMDQTSKLVRTLTDALGKNDIDTSNTTGRQDPFLLRLAVDRQVERQIDEENYLHQAYLNLESSGRELESIVVGEIQKAYNAYAGILKREADNAYSVIEELRDGPIAMPKDQEWIHFVTHDDQFVDPTIPLRTPDQIHYPGQSHVSAQEIRAGLLERKSKYLKSYTAGWYVLSTTHLHEFKSADKAQAPVMSLYLPEQKLGSHSEEGGSSNKFILKGRQTGTMHRGHTWVFRAESYDTMMAWYEDIRALTEKSPEERNHFVRTHSRSMSRSGSRRSMSSDGMVDDEDDEPFAAGSQIDVTPGHRSESSSRRPQPGGRFPSDIQVTTQRGLQAAHSPSSISSGAKDYTADPHVFAAAGALPSHHHQGEGYEQGQDHGYGGTSQAGMDEVPSSAVIASQEAQHDGVNPYTSEPVQESQKSYQHDNTIIAPIMMPAPVPRDLKQNDEADEGASAAATRQSTIDEGAASYQKTNGSTTQTTTETKTFVAVGAAGFPKSESAVESESQLTTTTDLETPMSQDTILPGEGKPVRPSSTNGRHDSVQTISNLHVPGGYPRGSIAGA